MDAVETAETTFKRTLGATILELRAAAGLTQLTLSQVLTEAGAAVSEAKVRRWEAGDHTPDAWEINRLASVLEVDPDQLVHPRELTDREIQLLRRVSRQARRTIDRERGVG